MVRPWEKKPSIWKYASHPMSIDPSLAVKNSKMFKSHQSDSGKYVMPLKLLKNHKPHVEVTFDSG